MSRRLAAALVCTALAGCGYRGSAVDASPAVAAEPGWIRVANVPLVEQRGRKDCGVAAMTMLLSYWGADATGLPDGGSDGLRAGDLRDLARARGLDAFLVTGDLADLETQLAKGRPVLVGLRKPVGLARGNRQRVLSHYEVVVGIHPASRRILTLDPAEGLRLNSFDGFSNEWDPAERLTLITFPR